MQRNADLANEIIRSLGVAVRSIREIVGQGSVNHVFVVDSSEGGWVVRFHVDPLDKDDYSKEAWCLRAAKEHGLCVPEFIAAGENDGVRYIVQTFIEGSLVDLHRSTELWTELGRSAKIINEIPLDESAPDSLFPRFGRDLVRNWNEHVLYNLQQLTPDDPLLELGAYPKSVQSELFVTFEALGSKLDRFGLTHGDLVPKNAILAPDGRLFIIDWGSAGTGAVPFNDYGRIWLDYADEGFTPDDLNAFADGYGVPVAGLLPVMRDLRLLGAIDIVRWAIDNRPDRIGEYVQRTRRTIESWRMELTQSSPA